jgi:hypothetical protein
MKNLFKLILGVLASLFKSRAKLEAETLILRQQISVLRRRAPKRPHLHNTDVFRLFGSIIGFPPSLAPLRLSGRKRSFAGTALGFGRIGAASLAQHPVCGHASNPAETQEWRSKNNSPNT